MRLGLETKGNYVLEFYGQSDVIFRVKCSGRAMIDAMREYVIAHETESEILLDKFINEEDVWIRERRDHSFSDKEGKPIRKNSVLLKKIPGKSVYANVISYEIDHITKDFISCVLIVKDSYEKIEITTLEELKLWLKVSISKINY